jgi:HD-GYP domain-containing protein (c-di-GMP phosphodiesterase class II)
LAAKDIPLIGRILALADTFDAMSSTRSYRPAMPREAVLAEISRCSGTQFDPELAELFVKLEFSEFDRALAGNIASDCQHDQSQPPERVIKPAA